MRNLASRDRSRFTRLTQAQCALVAALTCGEILAAERGAGPEANKAVTAFQSFTDKAANLVLEAISLIGIHYRYGGNSPEHGLDCSGLVRYVFKAVQGDDLPRTAEEISKLGETVPKQDLQPGDLVFFNTLQRAFSHVGIYLGDNKFIHAPSTGGAVRIENMDIAYWKQRFNGARRIDGKVQQN